jgi:cellulose synthase/poly-beta-1,6-N-acetylglucosamine synthase-like glycosyltransferase
MLWLALGTAFLLLALFPFFIYPFTLRFFPAKPIALGPNKQAVTLLFCCHNEAKSIAAKLANLKDILKTSPETKVMIYLDACTDNTAERIQKSKLPIRLFIGKGHKGKNAGLNLMMKHVTTPLAAFTDANVTIDPKAFQNAQRYFADASIGCVCGHLTYTNTHGAVRAAAKTGGLQWRFEEWLKGQETKTGSTPAVDGSLFLIRTPLFHPIPAETPNDFFSSLKILAAGHRVVSAPDVKAYEKAAEDTADETRRKIRISRRAMTCHLMLRKELATMPFADRYKYVSHKLIRWFAAWWLALAGFSFAWGLATLSGHHPLMWAFLIACPATWLVLTILNTRLTNMGNSIIMAFVSTAYGATTAILGARVSVWSIPASSR